MCDITFSELERVKELKAKNRSIDKKIEKLSKDREKIEVEILEEIMKYIQENNLLSETPWVFFGSEKLGSPCLRAKGNWHDFTGLCELLNPSYHSHFVLIKNPDERLDGMYPLVELHFSDGEVVLEFLNEPQMIDFVKKYNIKVDLCEISREVKDRKVGLERIEEAFEKLQKLFG